MSEEQRQKELSERCKAVLGLADAEQVATPLLLEQYIILKSMNDQNLPKLRGFDLQRFQQITADVFDEVSVR